MVLSLLTYKGLARAMAGSISVLSSKVPTLSSLNDTIQLDGRIIIFKRSWKKNKVLGKSF